MTKIEVYKRKDKKWAWRSRAENSNINATDGGQGFENKSDCVESLKGFLYAIKCSNYEITTE